MSYGIYTNASIPSTAITGSFNTVPATLTATGTITMPVQNELTQQVNPSTASQIFTLPTPTVNDIGKKIYVKNISATQNCTVAAPTGVTLESVTAGTVPLTGINVLATITCTALSATSYGIV